MATGLSIEKMVFIKIFLLYILILLIVIVIYVFNSCSCSGLKKYFFQEMMKTISYLILIFFFSQLQEEIGLDAEQTEGKTW